jgi:hypothetical protein
MILKTTMALMITGVGPKVDCGRRWSRVVLGLRGMMMAVGRLPQYLFNDDMDEDFQNDTPRLLHDF